MASDMTKQVEEFCEKHGVHIYATLLRHGRHFPDDKEERDVYLIVIKRDNSIHTWEFEFGQSLVNSGQKLATNIRRRLNNSCFPTHSDREYLCRELGVSPDRLTPKGDVRPVAPTAYDILACIEKGGPKSFDEFCANFGYDDDSIRAHATWEKWLTEALECERMFGDCMDELREIC